MEVLRTSQQRGKAQTSYLYKRAKGNHIDQKKNEKERASTDRVAKRIFSKQKESQIFQLARPYTTVMFNRALKANYLSIFNQQVQ